MLNSDRYTLKEYCFKSLYIKFHAYSSKHIGHMTINTVNGECICGAIFKSEQ